MLYRQLIAVFSQIHTKYINTLCGQNVKLLSSRLIWYAVTTQVWKVKLASQQTNVLTNSCHIDKRDICHEECVI